MHRELGRLLTRAIWVVRHFLQGIYNLLAIPLAISFSIATWNLILLLGAYPRPPRIPYETGAHFRTNN